MPESTLKNKTSLHDKPGEYKLGWFLSFFKL